MRYTECKKRDGEGGHQQKECERIGEVKGLLKINEKKMKETPL